MDDRNEDVTSGIDGQGQGAGHSIRCSICGREWSLEYELEELRSGNQAFERFALDHQRHTGHFPDGITPWLADCRNCPDGEAFLAERPAVRWAEAHARHTQHTVTLSHGTDGRETVRPEDARVIAADDREPRDGE